MAGGPISLAEVIKHLQTQWPKEGELGTIQTWHQPTVTYGISTSTPTNVPGAAPPEAGMNGTALVAMQQNQIEAAGAAFEIWDDLIAIDLVEATGTAAAQADITFNYSSSTNKQIYEKSSFASPVGPDLELTAANIWMSTTWPELNSGALKMNSAQWTGYLHEIGHSLGLSHPGTYTASSGKPTTYATTGAYETDARKFSIMSYFGAWSDKDGDGTFEFQYGASNYLEDLFPQTPMVDDVAAIQNKYGADLHTREGDTVYGFNSTAGLPLYDFTINKLPIFTIYDAGGNDTIDASLYNTNQTIDLRPGRYSSIGNIKDNVAVAYNEGFTGANINAVIENAIGGSGRDVLWGNEANNILRGNGEVDILVGEGGKDILDGGAGEDFMYGGRDDDTYFADSINDVAREEQNEGTDWVYASSDFQLGDWVENLMLLGTAVNGGGNELANVLSGTDGENNLYGFGGRDTLIGGKGADYLIGGTEDDTYYVDSALDIVWELSGEGRDTVHSSAGSFTLRDNVDDLILIDNATVGTGNGDANTIVGNERSNTIKGMGGADTIEGGGGNDILTGGAGTDTFVFATGWDQDRVTDFAVGKDRLDMTKVDGLYSKAQLTVIDTGQGAKLSFNDDSVTLTGVKASQLSNIEIKFSPAPVKVVPGQTLIGTAADDVLTGGAGNDHIEGGDGTNWLTGGAGADELIGGRNTDFLYVDADDTLINGGNGFDYAYLDTSKPYGASFKVAGTNVEYVGGTLSDDVIDASGVNYTTVLMGNYGKDTLIGGNVADRLSGSAGDDTLTGNGGADTFIFGGAYGLDTIKDFRSADGDLIDLREITTIHGIGDLLRVDNAAGNAEISFLGSPGNSITLLGVHATSLTAHDFLFAA